MSYIGSDVLKIYGAPADTDGKPFPHQSPAAQLQGEVLAVANPSSPRKVKGPQRGGHFSFFGRVTEASGGASALTVWYSNLPEPDVANDTHWVQDTTIGSIPLTGVANFFNNVGNVYAEWIRFKPVVAGDTASLVLWYRAEHVAS